MEKYKKLLLEGQYNILEEALKKEIENDDQNSKLWYLLFLASNNNYINFDSNNVNNEIAFNKAIEYASIKEEMHIKLEYNLYSNLKSLPLFDKLFRLYQFERYQQCKELLLDICDKQYSDVSLNNKLYDSIKYIFSSIESVL